MPSRAFCFFDHDEIMKLEAGYELVLMPSRAFCFFDAKAGLISAPDCHVLMPSRAFCFFDKAPLRQGGGASVQVLMPSRAFCFFDRTEGQ